MKDFIFQVGDLVRPAMSNDWLYYDDVDGAPLSFASNNNTVGVVIDRHHKDNISLITVFYSVQDKIIDFNQDFLEPILCERR